GRHEHLVRGAAGEPGTIAVVTLDGALIPRLAAVARREERVVHEIDPGVVEASPRVGGQVGVAEARVVRRARRTGTPEVAVAEPVAASVRRPPDVDLVAVVRDEA